jgi:hypothetical protein
MIVAYDWKLLRYANDMPVPGTYTVAADYLNLIGQAKEIGDDFGKQVRLSCCCYCCVLCVVVLYIHFQYCYSYYDHYYTDISNV